MCSTEVDAAWAVVSTEDRTLETCDATALVAEATCEDTLKLASEAITPSLKMSFWAPSWNP